MPAANPNQTISAQLNIIVNVLQTWAVQYNATVIPVSNVQDLWSQSSQTSQKPTVYVCFSGETPWSSNANISALTHRTSREFIVRVKQGRGFTAVRGETVYSFVTIVEQVRDTIRSMLGISQDFGVDYAGTKYVRLGSQVIDAYDLTFSVKADCPQIIQTPDDSENP